MPAAGPLSATLRPGHLQSHRINRAQAVPLGLLLPASRCAPSELALSL